MIKIVLAEGSVYLDSLCPQYKIEDTFPDVVFDHKVDELKLVGKHVKLVLEVMNETH